MSSVANTKFRISTSQNSLQALIAPRKVFDDARLLLFRNKNDDLVTLKEDEEVIMLWKKGYSVPWGTLLDIFIVLLYMFFCLTYQATKMTFVHDFNSIFNNYFMGNDDGGVTQIYFIDEFIENVMSVSEKFFTFDKTFPSQDKLERNSNLTVIVKVRGKEDVEKTFTEETVSELRELANKAIKEPMFKGLYMDVDYLITRDREDTLTTMLVKYSMSFVDMDDLGFIEWRSRFKKAETLRENKGSFSEHLSSDVYPLAIIVVDAFALMFTVTECISFLKEITQYAKNNYISFMRAFMWKVDRWELFDIFYRTLTFIAVTIFVTYVNNNLGEKYWPLVLLGTAAFMHTMGLFKSLKMKNELWMVARLIVKAVGQALAFVSGFVPMYVGYTFIGISLFGYFCNLFKGFLRSVKILFAIFHSDVVMDTEELIKSLGVVPDWVANLYVFVWTNLTCGIAINVVIAMVEETLGELIREQETENQD